MEKLTKENSVKVHAIFLYTQPFTLKLHLKMGHTRFLGEVSITICAAQGGMEVIA